MQQKHFPKGILRIGMALVILVLILSQFVGVVNAQDRKPPSREKVQIGVSLDEVQTYFGRLGDVNGPVGIVVEFEKAPAAVLYAESGGQAAPVKDQISAIKAEQSSFMQSLRDRDIKATELFRTQKAYNGIWLRVDPKDLKAIADIPGVMAIHPIVPKNIEHTTSVPLVGAPEVWAGLSAFQGETISIGVIDTGIDYIHTNFGGPGDYTGQDFTTIGEAGNLFPTAKVVGGWDFAGDAYNANDPNSVPAPDPDPMDCNGHGSHVSGTAAGYGVNPDGTTFAGDYATLNSLTAQQYIDAFRIGPGMAPKADLYALRVFGCSGSTDLTDLAIEWAMDPNGDNNLSDHLDVINMSLGSNFGSAYDSSAVASNNAALAGVIVVTSSGNSGDVYYITGSPGMAKYALSTANTVDSGAVVGAFELMATAGTMTPGTYSGTEAAFGPVLDATGVTGDLVYASTGTACTSQGALADLTGKIALIDRGTCTFVEKVKNAQNAGAIGALIANNAPGFPFTMGGTDATITIPSMMTGLDVGNALKADLVAGTVTVRLTSQYRDQFVATDTAVEDTLTASSSRGPARNGTLLKPDIAAPGDTIYSTATGTGNEGVSFGGTSMASPHVAGMMALLRQMHPDWSVAELKALAMNTATNDVYTGTSHTGNKYTPTRIGAGRASAANAVQSDVVAYYKNDPGQVSVAFGAVAVVSAQTFTKGITLSNKSGTPQDYNVAFDERYPVNPGLVWSLLDAGGAALSNPVTVPANGTLEIQVEVAVDPAALTRSVDATITGASRQRFAEGGGYVTLTSTGAAPTLRVPVHIAARPGSSMTVAESGLSLPAAPTGTFSLTPIGLPVDTVDDGSLVTILELKGESPNEASSSGAANNADIQYVGVGTDYPYWSFADGYVFFGISTYEKWDTSNAVEFDIYIDADEDGTSDVVLFNVTQGFFTGTTDDVMFSAYCSLSAGWCDAQSYMNYFSGTINTNAFNNNVMNISMPFTDIGLVDGVNTDFDFYVVSWSRDASGPVDITEVMSYDVANQSFTAVDPLITDEPVWYDIPGIYPTFEIGYDKAAIAANESKGLLLLHHHNAVNTAQVLTLPPSVSSIVRAGADPAVTATVDFTVTFSTDVTGVDSGDFQLATTGNLPGAAITNVSGGGDTYTVTVTVGANTGGTLGLNLMDDDSILDGASTPLGGLGLNNGDFTTGEIYTIPEILTLKLNSIATRDGWVLESAENSGVGGSLNATANTFNLGDDAADRQYRGILHFYTGGLPNNAVITKATLKIRKQGLVGTDPFTILKNLKADIRQGPFGTWYALQTRDFQAAASANAVATFGKVPVNNWYSANLNQSAFPFVNLTGPTQFRLAFTKDDNNNNVADYMKFFSGEASAAFRPQLIIEYYIPAP